MVMVGLISSAGLSGRAMVVVGHSGNGRAK